MTPYIWYFLGCAVVGLIAGFSPKRFSAGLGVIAWLVLTVALVLK
jgi:hypothetical protein